MPQRDVSTAVAAVVTLAADKNVTTDRPARRSSSSRALLPAATPPFAKNSARDFQSPSGHPRPKRDPRPPPPATPSASVLSYRCVRVDGHLLSGEIRIWRRTADAIGKGETSPFFYFVFVPLGTGFAAASKSSTLGIFATASRFTSRSTSV